MRKISSFLKEAQAMLSGNDADQTGQFPYYLDTNLRGDSPYLGSPALPLQKNPNRIQVTAPTPRDVFDEKIPQGSSSSPSSSDRIRPLAPPVQDTTSVEIMPGLYDSGSPRDFSEAEFNELTKDYPGVKKL